MDIGHRRFLLLDNTLHNQSRSGVSNTVDYFCVGYMPVEDEFPNLGKNCSTGNMACFRSDNETGEKKIPP